MNIKHLLPLQRIIGKMDNDFNIDQSDWIPRVAAWTIDCLAQLKCTPYIRRKIKYKVVDRIIRMTNVVNIKDIKVYDEHGCEIVNRIDSREMNITYIPQLNDYGDTIGGEGWSSEDASLYDDKEVVDRLSAGSNCINRCKNFVVVDNNKIELNYDAKFVIVEVLRVATYYDDYFNEEVPFVYDNGVLLEAICWYCLMKMLQRGYKHQVFSLSGNEAVNPYIQWNKIKDQAAASVRKDLRNPSKNEGWNNFFYNSTFLPRG